VVQIKYGGFLLKRLVLLKRPVACIKESESVNFRDKRSSDRTFIVGCWERRCALCLGIECRTAFSVTSL
jgi:hypothetical protein